MNMKSTIEMNGNLIGKAKSLLDKAGFKGAYAEFNSAVDYYNCRKFGPCISEINKAYESTMKSILKNLKITPKNNKTGSLITALHKHGVLPSYLDNKANTLKNLFETGLMNIRNQEGIGQGHEIKEVPQRFADLAMNESCSFIIFLIEQYFERKPQLESKATRRLLTAVELKLYSGKGKSSTAASYLQYIRKFLDKIDKKPEDITKNDIVQYLKDSKSRYATHTLWLLSSALKFLTNDVLKNNFDYYQIRKDADIGEYPNGRSTKKITEDEFNSLIENETNEHHKFWMKFIWHTGVSLRQFRNTKKKDLDLKQGKLKIRDGNEIIDTVKLPTDFLIKCKDFIDKYAKDDFSDYLFRGYKGGIISHRTPQHAIWLAGKQAGIKRNINPYILSVSNPHVKREKRKLWKKSKKTYSKLRGIRSPLKPLSEDELTLLCSGNVNLKHKYWFKLIYQLGIYQLMRDELYSMKVSDVNLKDRIIKIDSKWEKLSDALFALFSEYFAKFPNHKYVFQNKDGDVISERGIRDALDRARRYNNITKKINYENLHKSILESNL